MIPAGALAALLLAQQFDQRGFVENRTLVYPRDGANDGGHVVDEMLLRWELSFDATPWLSLRGAFDTRSDTHRQTARTLDLDVDGRNIAQPAFSIRRASAVVHRGGFTGEIGRQFIRWGKTDILTPTDRFAPRDFLASVVDSDFLGVWATRATYERGGDTIDAIWQPHFTPARAPLPNQRWTVPPRDAVRVFPVVDSGARYPGGSQWGVRWNHVASGYEYSLSYFDGYQALPSFEAQIRFPAIEVARVYPRLRMVGGDGAAPLAWFTLKGEAAYLSSPTPGAEEYVLYVVQAERLVGEWFFVGGYAGSVITRVAENSQFAADRGFAKSFVGRAGWTIDANRSLAVETAVRAGGSFLRFEYSQAYGQHWRATAGTAWIRGDEDDFLGQYRRNSYLSLALRYSF